MLPDGMFPVVNAVSYMNFPSRFAPLLNLVPPVSLSSNYRDSSLLFPSLVLLFPPFQIQFTEENHLTQRARHSAIPVTCLCEAKAPTVDFVYYCTVIAGNK